MTQAVEFRIALKGGLWSLSRDGAELHSYSHAERAVHEAASLARELAESGQPARVLLQTAEDQWIEVSTEPETPEAPEDAAEERSAVNPAR